MTKRTNRFNRPLVQFICLAIVAAFTAAAFDGSDLRGQPAAPAPAANADRLVIVVESVSGTVYYTRGGRRQRVTIDSKLSQGDRVHANPGAICKLEFQRPVTEEVLSAVIVRGYSDMEITQALQQGPQTRTLLDVRQGVIRAGVVRTAVPPSFRVRTPRSVVAVRGTEIAELEASIDRGDSLTMGIVGAAMTNDAIPRSRSARAFQGILKRAENDRRGGRLLRAIEVAALRPSRTIAGPHRRGFEVDFVRRVLVSRPFLYNSGESNKREGNLNRDRLINGQGRSDLADEQNLINFFNQQNQHNPGGQQPMTNPMTPTFNP
ncbi:MAG: hypothetical protein HOL01_06265 [Planctomycetaceae bacterium]|nr:hypothetical protein [Planctomycetaceae bacterium]MBT6484760.1 hypothetical protein [Planctomycetaceae bacterium]MBT6494142.1 hypothetical protein [Planctomycetaceae bacterium]